MRWEPKGRSRGESLCVVELTRFPAHPIVSQGSQEGVPDGTPPPEGDRDRPRGRYCPSCLDDRRKEVGISLGAYSARTASDLLIRTGKRPTHTPEAKLARQEGNVAQRAQQAAWEATHAGEVHDPAWFTREILPGIRGMSLTKIADATGMSTSSASKIRAGRRVPHPRHWGALADVAGVGVAGEIPGSAR